jgi:hypothetical protein
MVVLGQDQGEHRVEAVIAFSDDLPGDSHIGVDR